MVEELVTAIRARESPTNHVSMAPPLPAPTAPALSPLFAFGFPATGQASSGQTSQAPPARGMLTGQQTPGTPPVEKVWTDTSKLLENFQKYRPPYFSGVTYDPLAPTKWIGVEKAFSVLGYNDEQKILCATYRLQNEAYALWNATRPILSATYPQPILDQFVEVFYGNYFPISVRDRKESELMALQPPLPSLYP
ncbi:uncharacterized protein LOC122086222 [Macadamia integrifolia]|uniref:uncharacterized protein LOC122086222 n=1 Tax=Macadamia integrifolia TaxID=60698 RepID=UPI001C4F81C0|nr:uncharacterized protein LOC122086222 [Macadamia integrifolia]